MKKTPIALLVMFACYQINAQEFDSAAYKFSNEIKAETIKKHLEVIASDEYEGRETGKKGQKMTMDYLIKEFKSYGIADYKDLKYKQSYPLMEQENKGIDLIIGKTNFVLFEDFTLSPNFIANRDIKGMLSFISAAEEVNKGTNGFIWKKDTAENYLKSIREQVKTLDTSGLATLFYYDDRLSENLSKYGHYYKKSRTKLASELNKEDGMLRIALSDSGIEKLLKESKIKREKLDKKGTEELEDFSLAFNLKINKPNRRMSGENVLAYIPGTDKKEELIVITAHYDHLGKEDSVVYNGADDDGTGTVSLLEIAQSFKLAEAAGFKNRRSILVMPVSGEEKGLLGSKYYSDNPIFPLKNTVTNLNIDMIGRYDKNHTEDSNYVYLIGADKLSQQLHDLSEGVNKTYTQFNLDYRYNDESDPNRFYYRSDHYNFAKNNIPVIFYFSGVHEDYHRASDTVEKIDYEKTAKIARLVFLTAWEIANREERLELNQTMEKGGTN